MARKRVLIAEDEPNHRDIIGTILSYGGYEVLEALDGAEAVRIAVERQPDLVLMDVALPVLNGWQATAQIKKHPATACIPVVIVTVHTQDGDLLRSDQSGCDSYIAKPCEPSSVLAEVARWIGPA
jgi:two-component system, cell cycle response regulator DivK